MCFYYWGRFRIRYWTFFIRRIYETTKETIYFYQHLEKTLLKINFLHPENKNSLIAKLKRLFNKALLVKPELNILRGILTAIDKKVKND